MEIDFQLIDGIILLEVIVNSQKGYFAFDTGSIKTTVNSKYCKVICEKERDVTIYDGQLETRKIREGQIQYLKVGDFEFINHHVLELDLSYVSESLGTKDYPFLGTIGMDLISKYCIRIDYINNKLIFGEPQSTSTNKKGYTFDWSSGLIIMEIKIKDNCYPVVIDTGSNRNLILPEVLSEIVTNKNTSEKKIAEKVEFLGEQYPAVNFKSAVATEHFERLACAGLIGYDLLKGKVIEIDFVNKKISASSKKN